MEKKRIIALGAIATISVMLMGVGAGIFSPKATVTIDGKQYIVDGTTVKGNILWVYGKSDGTIEVHGVPNTVTNIAKNQTRDVRMGRITATTGANTTWLSYGLSTDTNATAATDTLCAGLQTANGIAPINGTADETLTTIGNYSIYARYYASATTGAIAKACVSNFTSATAMGPLMASACLYSPCTTTLTLNNHENVTFYHYIGEA